MYRQHVNVVLMCEVPITRDTPFMPWYENRLMLWHELYLNIPADYSLAWLGFQISIDIVINGNKINRHPAVSAHIGDTYDVIFSILV